MGRSPGQPQDATEEVNKGGSPPYKYQGAAGGQVGLQDRVVAVLTDKTTAMFYINKQVGVEILSNLFGTLHPGFYGAERQSFTYERRPASQAYVPHDEGDFYYAGGFFGGTIKEVYKLSKKCHEAIMVDKDKRIEAIWQEESHLNKYFVYHKPTKILSPEYVWDDNMGRPEILRKRRFLAVPKNHAAIRNK
nr:histo-blood group ABO system transferase 1-like [Pelodiscus sinensis]|eukprot:XP_014433165.1 histo-blood group ABO system transferase 1-like [Pelodiscus sinensis]